MTHTITIKITKPKLLFIVFGLLMCLGLAWHQYIMFLRAFMSPQKAIILYINVFGEANGEMLLLTPSIIIGTIATLTVLWFIFNGQRISVRKDE